METFAEAISIKQNNNFVFVSDAFLRSPPAGGKNDEASEGERHASAKNTEPGDASRRPTGEHPDDDLDVSKSLFAAFAAPRRTFPGRPLEN